MEPRSNSKDWQARLRLWAAIVLGSYQLLSMVLYSAGLISGQAMKDVEAFETPFFVLFPVFAVALYVHMGLGLWKLYRRNTLTMPLWEAAQIALGLLIPLLMLTPLLAMTAMDWKFATGGTAPEALMVNYPEIAWRSVAMNVVVGLHAHIGTHAVLRMRPWYPRLKWTIVGFFTVVTLGAALGVLQSGSLAAYEEQETLTQAELSFLRWADLGFSASLLGLYGVLFVARALRLRLQQDKNTVRIDYAGGGSVQVAPPTTVLEASRIGGIPHASICGGRGRCTTCRIRVVAGMENLSPVGDREHKALVRIGAAPDIRLACQAECRGGPLEIAILLPPNVHPKTARRETRDSVGRDVELAVMFIDLRGFTGMSDKKFPYDVVYILNNYFQVMGNIIEANHGKIDKFLGDGILAYFGLDVDPREGCRSALLAAREMGRRLQDLNLRLSHVLPHGLSLGIGIHFGDLVLGEVGFQDRRQLTIIGDTVNIASRLEALNKQARSQLILSTTVAALAGADLSHLPLATITPRGKDEPLRVYVVRDILKGLDKL